MSGEPRAEARAPVLGQAFCVLSPCTWVFNAEQVRYYLDPTILYCLSVFSPTTLWDQQICELVPLLLLIPHGPPACVHSSSLP